MRNFYFNENNSCKEKKKSFQRLSCEKNRIRNVGQGSFFKQNVSTPKKKVRPENTAELTSLKPKYLLMAVECKMAVNVIWP